MIRWTLRQFRPYAISALCALGALAVLLAATGPHLAALAANFVATCGDARRCAGVTNPVTTTFHALQIALPLIVMITPALVGMFFGAPLIARELETGSYRLAWTQGVTWRRWLAVKLAVVGAAAIVTGGLVTWMVDWWLAPIDRAMSNGLDPTVFSYHGIVPLGYAAFAFALGAAAGTLLRRAVPAMAVAAVGFAAARVVMTFWLRPLLITPVTATMSLLGEASPNVSFLGGPNLPGGPQLILGPPGVNLPGAWVYGSRIVDSSGHTPAADTLAHACPELTARIQSGGLIDQQQFEECTARLAKTYHAVATYQPASRYWAFQWIETGIFTAAALVLCVVIYVWLRRRFAA